MKHERAIGTLSGLISRKRVARSLVTVIALSLIQVTLPVTSNLFMPSAQAANLFENRANFQQWTTWHGVAANHVPYRTSAGTAEITANSDSINLTQDAGSQTGFLWNTQTYSYDQDLTVSANYFLGAKDGADGIMFAMRPLNQWPNGGTAGAATGTWQHWGTGEIRAIFDTYQNGSERADDHLRVQGVTTAGVETTYTGAGVLLKNSSGADITEVENNQSYPFTIRWTAATRTFAVFSGLSANHLIYSTQITSGQMNSTQFAWGWMGFTGGASNFQAISDVSYHVGPTVSSSDTHTTVIHGASVTLSATSTTSESSPTRRWEFSTDGGSTWTSTGISTASYTFTADRSFTQRRYRFYIESTAVGITYSKSTTPIILTVLPPTLGADTDTAITTSGTKYATLANSNPLIPGTISTISLEAWVRPSTLCDGAIACTIFTIDKSYLVQVVNGKIRHYIGSGTAWCDAGVGKDTVDAVVSGGRWTHVTFVRVNANVKIYINGQLRSNLNSSCSPATQAANTNAFVIGAKGANSEPFLGHIDEVRMWSTDRSSNAASDMHSNETSTAGLVAYWNFNEGSASIAYNQLPGATSASDLTIVDSTAWDSAVVSQEVVGAAYTTRTFYRSYITSRGGWIAPSPASRFSALIVAGGGGGGYNSGGGGSGGGVVHLPTVQLSSVQRITVGTGGAGADSTGSTPQSGTSSQLGSTSVNGGNPGQNYAVGILGGTGITTSTGKSGDGGQGTTSSSVAGSAGGAGISNSITGSPTSYAGGGGGGGWDTSSNGGAGGAGGGGAGGTTSNRSGVTGTENSGSGGGASSRSGLSAGSGGSGVIVIRWITAAKPIFTQPTNDTTTAGLTDTITVSNNPNSPLIRNFQWQRSIDTGTTWSNITTGSGITSNTYTTPILDTSTSGSRFQYRVIVTDSDTAGLFIVDTSTAVFIVINPPISISGTYTVQKYGQTHTDTFTAVTGTGTGNKTFTFTPNRAGLTWNGATANQATLTVASTLGPGTYLETMTATDTRGAQTSLAISVVVTKADTVTVTTLALADTYTGSALSFTPRFTVTGLLNSDTVTPITWNYQGADNAGTTYSISQTRPMNAGSYTISGAAPLALNDSYTAVRVETATLTINRATRTITMGALASPIKYGDTRTATATPSLGSGDGVITYATTTSDSCTVTSTTIRAVRPSGTCSFTATIARGNNFESATTTSPVTATLSRADTLTVRVSNPVTLTFTGSTAATLPTVTLVGLAHTDTGTVTRLYSAPASLPGSPETYTALVDSPSTPVDVESYTVGASFAFTSGASSNYLNVVVETSTLRINQANQAPLRIALYNAWVGSPFTILTEGGNGLGTVVETITAGSTATDCRINSRVLTMTSTTASSCNILVTKAATRNYRAETATATINFLLLVFNQPSPPAGSGPNVALTGENDVTTDLVGAPTITAISPSVISLGAGGSFTISGTGFGSAPVTVKFWRDKSVTITPANGSTIIVPVADIAAANGQSGRVLVINVGGTAVSVERLTINP